MAFRLGRDELKARLRAASPAILPSLLACDFAHLEQEVSAVEAAGVPALHLDVMDGHFVPNISIGVPIVQAVRRITDLPLDVHLMISNPAEYVEAFRKAGADSLTIHIETMKDPRPVLDKIRALGALAGLAINPLYGRVKEARLSPVILEVLSVLAYNQPATAERLSELRGAPSGAALSTLVRRRLVKLERCETGSPQYSTTERFLKLFGLENLEALPRAEELGRA